MSGAPLFGECRTIRSSVQFGILFNLVLLFRIIQEMVFQLSDVTNGAALASKGGRFSPAPRVVARPFGTCRTIPLPAQLEMLFNLLLSFPTTQERAFQLSDVTNGVALASKGNRLPPAPRLVARPFGEHQTILLPAQLGMLLNLLLSFLTTQKRVFQVSDLTIGAALVLKGSRFPPAPSLVARPFGECRTI